VVKLPRVADDTCCGVHDPLQLVRHRFRCTSQQAVAVVNAARWHATCYISATFLSRVTSVAISLEELVGQMSKCLKFCTGIEIEISSRFSPKNGRLCTWAGGWPSQLHSNSNTASACELGMMLWKFQGGVLNDSSVMTLRKTRTISLKQTRLKTMPSFAMPSLQCGLWPVSGVFWREPAFCQRALGRRSQWKQLLVCCDEWRATKPRSGRRPEDWTSHTQRYLPLPLSPSSLLHLTCHRHVHLLSNNLNRFVQCK